MAASLKVRSPAGDRKGSMIASTLCSTLLGSAFHARQTLTWPRIWPASCEIVDHCCVKHSNLIVRLSGQGGLCVGHKDEFPKEKPKENCENIRKPEKSWENKKSLKTLPMGIFLLRKVKSQKGLEEKKVWSHLVTLWLVGVGNTIVQLYDYDVGPSTISIWRRLYLRPLQSGGSSQKVVSVSLNHAWRLQVCRK